MFQPDIPSVHDLLTAWPRYIAFPAFWAAGWLVTETSIPADYRATVTVAVVVGSTVAIYAGAGALGIELSGGRCRARTTDGTRCQHPRPPGADCCRAVHQRLYDVELVDEDGEI